MSVLGKYRVPVGKQGCLCETAVISCGDHRLRESVADHVDKHYGAEGCDHFGIPGGVKAFINGSSLAAQAVEVPINLHKVKKIVFMNHADCGAYGGRANFNHDRDHELSDHTADLLKAREKVLEQYPKLEVDCLFVNFEEVDGHREIEIIDVLN